MNATCTCYESDAGITPSHGCPLHSHLALVIPDTAATHYSMKIKCRDCTKGPNAHAHCCGYFGRAPHQYGVEGMCFGCGGEKAKHKKEAAA